MSKSPPPPSKRRASPRGDDEDEARPSARPRRISPVAASPARSPRRSPASGARRSPGSIATSSAAAARAGPSSSRRVLPIPVQGDAGDVGPSTSAPKRTRQRRGPPPPQSLEEQNALWHRILSICAKHGLDASQAQRLFNQVVDQQDADGNALSDEEVDGIMVFFAELITLGGQLRSGITVDWQTRKVGLPAGDARFRRVARVATVRSELAQKLWRSIHYVCAKHNLDLFQAWRLFNHFMDRHDESGNALTEDELDGIMNFFHYLVDAGQQIEAGNPDFAVNWQTLELTLPDDYASPTASEVTASYRSSTGSSRGQRDEEDDSDASHGDGQQSPMVRSPNTPSLRSPKKATSPHKAKSASAEARAAAMERMRQKRENETMPPMALHDRSKWGCNRLKRSDCLLRPDCRYDTKRGCVNASDLEDADDTVDMYLTAERARLPAIRTTRSASTSAQTKSASQSRSTSSSAKKSASPSVRRSPSASAASSSRATSGSARSASQRSPQQSASPRRSSPSAAQPTSPSRRSSSSKSRSPPARPVVDLTWADSSDDSGILEAKTIR